MINEGTNLLFKDNYFVLDKQKYHFPDDEAFDNEDKIEFSLNDNLYNINNFIHFQCNKQSITSYLSCCFQFIQQIYMFHNCIAKLLDTFLIHF